MTQPLQYAAANDQKSDADSEIAEELNRARPAAAHQIGDANTATAHSVRDKRHNGPFDHDYRQVLDGADMRPTGREVSDQTAREREPQHDEQDHRGMPCGRDRGVGWDCPCR